MSEPTLGDLYGALDWSGTDQQLAEWQTAHPQAKDRPEGSFKANWRYTLLMYALPQELTGDQVQEWSSDKQESAKMALSRAGVWPQVVDWLLRYDLIGAADSDQVEQLHLPLPGGPS